MVSEPEHSILTTGASSGLFWSVDTPLGGVQLAECGELDPRVSVSSGESGMGLVEACRSVRSSDLGLSALGELITATTSGSG